MKMMKSTQDFNYPRKDPTHWIFPFSIKTFIIEIRKDGINMNLQLQEVERRIEKVAYSL